MMTVIHGIVIDCADAPALSAFWQAVLGWEYRMQDPEWCSLRNPAGGPHLSFQLVPEGKVVKNRVHIDIRPETGTLDEERKRIEALGATALQFFDKGEWSHWVMSDPEGDEFCILSPEHARAT
jgi:predicted enzyme related to lactoylglutathione lyase